MASLQQLSSRRISSLNYLNLIHSQQARWLNILAMDDEFFLKNFDSKTMKKRLEMWFRLGKSLGDLLKLPDGMKFVRSLVQLVEEFEYFGGGSLGKGLMKGFKAKQIGESVVDESELGKPTIIKHGKSIVYQFFDTDVSLPYLLDYRQVVFSLCDILSQVYEKIARLSHPSQAVIDAIVKVDRMLKKQFFGWICKQLSAATTTILKQHNTPQSVIVACQCGQPIPNPPA